MLLSSMDYLLLCRKHEGISLDPCKALLSYTANHCPREDSTREPVLSSKELQSGTKVTLSKIPFIITGSIITMCTYGRHYICGKMLL